LNPRDLIDTARDLLKSTSGKPRQSNLHRATSTAYYAMFHTLARCAADLLIGGPGSKRSSPAWQQVYRALEHGVAKNACSNGGKLALFPREIQDFANTFVTMQEKRHKADYDPNAKSRKSEVAIDIDLVDKVITDFGVTPIKDRRAFAALVLFKPPRK
ncbi:unnamed protein product, partial [Phaeothamnion confervicola]